MMVLLYDSALGATILLRSELDAGSKMYGLDICPGICWVVDVVIRPTEP